MNTLAEEVEWSRKLYEGLNENGKWGIPRSGLIFQKRNGKLVLVDRMPHTKDMPITAQLLAEQQHVEFTGVKRRFELAGIPVEDETKMEAN